MCVSIILVDCVHIYYFFIINVFINLFLCSALAGSIQLQPHFSIFWEENVYTIQLQQQNFCHKLSVGRCRPANTWWLNHVHDNILSIDIGRDWSRRQHLSWMSLFLSLVACVPLGTFGWASCLSPTSLFLIKTKHKGEWWDTSLVV